MRNRCRSGVAILPYGELEYGEFRDTVGGLLDGFAFRDGYEAAGIAKLVGVSASDDQGRHGHRLTRKRIVEGQA